MIIGTAGHIDHGKTTLVRALTGIDTDRLAEEKARGISIDLGFAYLPAADGSVLAFVDVPGHERFIRNMLAGATGIDLVLLAVAADDGVMPQTREHVSILDLLGVDRGMVALTKADLADAGRRAEVTCGIARILEGTTLAGAAIIPVSTLTGEGIDELRIRLLAASRMHARSASRGRFRLAVDRSFTLTGVGTIVTGTVQSGTVAVGDRVVVSPSGLAARVRSIHAQDRPSRQGGSGERCALNLAGDGVGKSAIARGDVVLHPELHAPTQRIDAMLRVLPGEPAAITQWMPARLHHACTEVGARVVPLAGTAIAPGCAGRVQLVLQRPIAASCGDRFVLRDTSARRTIGGGRLIDLRAPTRRRRTPERHARLDALALTDPAAALAALLERPPRYVELDAFARDRALAAAELEEICAALAPVRLPTPAGVVALSQQAWSLLEHGLADTLGAFHATNPDMPGLSIERLRAQVDPRLPPAAFAAALQMLARSRKVALEGAHVRLPAHAPVLKPVDEALWRRISPLIGGAARFRPPRVNEIAGHLRATEDGVRRLLKLLGRLGQVDEIAPDHFFLRSAVAEMAEIAAALAAGSRDGQLTAAQFRDRLDNGRKVAIQVLEFFDRRGVTLRSGDLRRVNQGRLDLFARPPDGSPFEPRADPGGETSPVGRPDFKSGRGRQPVLGGFDSHSLPPKPRRTR